MGSVKFCEMTDRPEGHTAGCASSLGNSIPLIQVTVPRLSSAKPSATFQVALAHTNMRKSRRTNIRAANCPGEKRRKLKK
ncbi:hypothetical protein EYF80_021701 [Liparis tanakae]|uniref:Uncharacterized protein n=1 Tax=Liparis tanakae TaxID=230148 RepID=A0A4Z2HQD5_9TELE|nr:hypothetical protein EYF80_021701 [Liparis tanakae]